MIPTALRVWLGALLLLGGYAGIELWAQHRDDARERRLEQLVGRLQTQHQLDDSTAVRQAALTARLNHIEAHLEGIANAAKELGGRPVAGAGIRVRARDTVVVHDTIMTIVHADSSRTGTFTDSTFAGRVTVDVTAPPFPAALKAKLSIHRPEFRPEVGFVQIGKQVVATVVWQGERVEIEHPFFAPKPPRARRVEPWAEATYNFTAPHSVRAGVGLNLGRFAVGPSAGHRLARAEPTELGVTLRAKF